jgi:hypothetical protein
MVQPHHCRVQTRLITPSSRQRPTATRPTTRLGNAYLTTLRRKPKRISMLKKHIKQGIKKEHNAIATKKHKSNEDDDLNMLDVGLQNLNYGGLENMKMDSDLEVNNGEIST